MPPQMNQNLQAATNSFPPRVESRTLVGQMEAFEVFLLVVRLMPYMSGMQLIERVSMWVVSGMTESKEGAEAYQLIHA